jgi:hypothetical protein
MKNIYLKSLFLILFLNFYSISAQTVTIEKENLIGEWTLTKSLSASETELFELSCNPCSKINFAENKITVKNPGGSEETYSWKIENEKVIIKNLGEKKTSNMFKSDGEFSGKLINGKNYMELKLADSDYNGVVMRK